MDTSRSGLVSAIHTGERQHSEIYTVRLLMITVTRQKNIHHNSSLVSNEHQAVKLGSRSVSALPSHSENILNHLGIVKLENAER